MGKADWIAAGLPTARQNGGERRAIDVAEREVTTCRPEDTVEAADDAAHRAGTHTLIVVDEHRIVLGRFHAGAGDADQRVQDAMEPGPTTVRASEPLDALLGRMKDHGTIEMIVTTPQGELLGLIRRSEEEHEG